MEDIHVRHSAYAATASFDVRNRILTLPIWKNMTVDIIDMLTGHEVGHSLWTLPDEWKEAIDEGIHKGILNIVEDARIEKKIKRKYPGIVKPFLSAYRELFERGFFGHENPNDLNFIDRINLYCKLGSLAGIKFDDPAEQEYLDLVMSCETFFDVVEVSKILQMAYSQEVSTMVDDHDWIPGDGDGEEDDETGKDFKELQNDDEGSNSKKSETSEGSLDKGDERENEAAGETWDSRDFDADEHRLDDEEEFSTESTWEDRKQELVDDKSTNYQYIGMPKANLVNMIIPYKVIVQTLAKETAECYAHNDYGMDGEGHLMIHTQEYVKFKTASNKIVNYMAKEFERKKAAEVYRRQAVSKTGVLDINKLHSYKYNDDIFLRKIIVPDGKNHGLVMLIDWSASMYYNIENTLKQVLNLVWFCQKVNIPFEVYSFSACWRDDELADMDVIQRAKWHNRQNIFNYKIGDAAFGGTDSMRLLNLLSSRMTASEMTVQSKNLFFYGRLHQNRSLERYRKMGLGSTPTVEALLGMLEIIPNFKKAYKLDKVNLITLTDGEPNSQLENIINSTEEDTRRGHISWRTADKVIYEDPTTRKQYDVTEYMGRADRNIPWRHKGEAQAAFLLDLLKDRYGINNVGIYLDSSRRVDRRTLEKYLGWYQFNVESHKTARKQIKQEGFCTITNAGFNEYYIMPMGNFEMNTDTDYDVDPDATVAKIKRAFTKSLNQKFGSRVLVDRLMTWIT